MVELLKHPLTVLLVGALISGLLIPAFTRRWQNHQKALEIKTQLVSDLSKLQAYFADTAIPTEWTLFSARVEYFYAREGYGADKRSGYAADLAKSLGVSSGYQSDQEWVARKDEILERKSALIQEVLKAEVSVLV